MKHIFLVDLPFKKSEIDKGELFIDQITDSDIQKKKTESLVEKNLILKQNFIKRDV